MLSVHLKVAGRNFHEHLKQVHLRPFVLVLLLCDLIDRGHPVFDENMTAQVLKETVERQVAERYPETEAHIPREERKGHIPSTIKQMIEDQYSDRTGNDKIPLGLNKMVTVHFEKHAVPESAARAIEDAMEDITPSSLHTEKWPSYEGKSGGEGLPKVKPRQRVATTAFSS